MTKPIDKGFCLSYWKLSYRRKLIRTLWTIPLVGLLILLPEHSFILKYFTRAEVGGLLFLAAAIQATYNYLKWKRAEGTTNQNNPENSKEEDSTPLSSIPVIILSAPVIVGAIAIIIAKTFRPGEAMPLETVTDRLFVNVFTLGVPLGMLGLPLFLVGVVMGVRFLWREHAQGKQSLIVILTLAIGIAASLYIVAGTIAVRKKYPPKHMEEGTSSNKTFQPTVDKAGLGFNLERIAPAAERPRCAHINITAYGKPNETKVSQPSAALITIRRAEWRNAFGKNINTNIYCHGHGWPHCYYRTHNHFYKTEHGRSYEDV
jgi:hypothetical protein